MVIGYIKKYIFYYRERIADNKGMVRVGGVIFGEGVAYV